MEEPFESIIPFGDDEVMETAYYNGQMCQMTRVKTDEDKERLKERKIYWEV